MKTREITRQLTKLQSLIKRTEEACGENIELQAHWAKYICILSAGLLENAMKEIYSDYALKTVSRPIANFINSQISKFSNPKSTRFIEVAGMFKEGWKTELETFLAIDGRDEAIDSIMNNRHLIAHGKEQDSRLSLAQVKSYLAKSIEVLEYIENQCQA